MPRNGQGIYTLPVGNPVITGTTITSTWGNTTMQDIANALTGSVASDGQTTMSGPLNMGSNRINNVDNPVLPQDAATMDYVDTAVGDLGTMARQNADNVQITGGSIQGVLLNLGGTTGQMYLPKGTSGQKTTSPTVGLMRFNTDSVGQYQGFYEGYTLAGWQRFVTVNEGDYRIEYNLIGGGGGGASGYIGGGGGGGQITKSTTDVIPGSTILTITIGGGGSPDNNGAVTQIVGVGQAVGGSRGVTKVGGTSGNGFPGGTNTEGGYGNSGGGGGAGAGGGNGYFIPEGLQAGGYGGSGGGGAEILITGTSQFLAGGGGGSGQNFGGGGANGGGNGSAAGAGTVGAANTGGGGGGGMSGGSGIAWLKMLTANYTGDFTGNPQVIVSGDYTVLKYTGSGTYIC